MKRTILLTTLFVGAHVFVATVPAIAQQFPTRPIEDAVWSSAGGGTDLVNRLIAKAMEKELGVKINVVNRTGGGGGIAMDHVWSQPHDGYNWLGASEAMQNSAVMGFHPTTTKDWRWYMVAGASGTISVRANSPYKTIDDLIKAAQANPGKINVGHSAIGSVWHLKTIALANAAKIKVNYVPYDGSAPAMVAAMTGEADAVISSISEQGEYIKADRLRPLGMVEMTPYAFPGRESIPAIGVKYPDLAKIPTRQWLGFAIPADTPKSVTDRLDAAFVKAMQDPALNTIAKDRYLTLFGTYGDEAMKTLLPMESVVSWKLQELGVSKISPEKFGILKP